VLAGGNVSIWAAIAWLKLGIQILKNERHAIFWQLRTSAPVHEASVYGISSPCG
jgi:hypothetical protein